MPFPYFLLTKKLASLHQIPKTVCVSVNLCLELLLQPHLSQQQEPRQLSKSHQMCSSTWLLCASCPKLTMLKFVLKNDLAPNYPNNLYCNLPWPKTELMFKAAQSSENASFIRRWGYLGLGLACWRGADVQMSPDVIQGLPLHHHSCNLPSHLCQAALTVLPSTSGQCFHLKGCYTLPNKYINEVVLL